MNEATIIHWVLQIVVGASILHVILPPYDVFNDFPTLQKYYKLFVAIVAWLALNVRTKVIQAYPSIKALNTSGSSGSGSAPPAIPPPPTS
jgi:hypothetical protein